MSERSGCIKPEKRRGAGHAVHRSGLMAETLTCHVWMPIQVQLQAEEGAEGAAAAVVAGRWCAPALRRPLFPGRFHAESSPDVCCRRGLWSAICEEAGHKLGPCPVAEFDGLAMLHCNGRKRGWHLKHIPGCHASGRRTCQCQ